MQVSKSQMIELVMKMYRPYRCRYCINSYDGTCSPKACCNVGIERFFSVKARTLSQSVKLAEEFRDKLISNRRKYENCSR